MSDSRDRLLSILRGPGSPAGTPEPVALVLAPMATLTHAALRTLVGEFGGCDLYFSEMISAEALVNGTPYERYYLLEHPDPGRLVFQLVGYAEDSLVAATQLLSQTGAAGIDINMGCSAPHIVRKGGGIAWTRDPERAARLIGRLRAALPGMSLSVKLRLGESDDSAPLIELCRRLEASGADFLTLHPKRRRDGPARRARWSAIGEVRAALPIPVIGNGGVTGWTALGARLGEAGRGPVMIGRAAARAPWIFAYLRQRQGGMTTGLSVDLMATGIRFLELLEAYQPRDFLHSRARRFLPYLLSNIAFGHSIAARVAQAPTYASARDLFLRYFEKYPESALHVERG